MERLDEILRIECISTVNSIEKAAQLYCELDGRVDAFGVGGVEIGLTVGMLYDPLYFMQPMIRYIKKTPNVNAEGLPNTIEIRIAPFLVEKNGNYF